MFLVDILPGIILWIGLWGAANILLDSIFRVNGWQTNELAKFVSFIVIAIMGVILVEIIDEDDEDEKCRKYGKCKK